MIGIMDWDEVEKMWTHLREASEAGLVDASIEYGRALLDGIAEPPDPETAVAAFRAAVEQGAGREAKLSMLRTAYFFVPDALEPAEVRERVVELLDDDPTGEVALLKGYFHYRGFGFEQDLAQSVAWHEKAAAKGNADAMFELYVLHSTGQGTEPNQDLAIEWAMRAAEAGNIRAMYNLGGFFATGNGVEQNDQFALDWYEKAAHAGHGRAAATLAVMLVTGQGAETDLERAESFYELAYENGFDADELFWAMGLENPFEG